MTHHPTNLLRPANDVSVLRRSTIAGLKGLGLIEIPGLWRQRSQITTQPGLRSGDRSF